MKCQIIEFPEPYSTFCCKNVCMNLKNSHVCFELNETKLCDWFWLPEPVRLCELIFVGDLDAYWIVEAVRLNDLLKLCNIDSISDESSRLKIFLSRALYWVCRSNRTVWVSKKFKHLSRTPMIICFVANLVSIADSSLVTVTLFLGEVVSVTGFRSKLFFGVVAMDCWRASPLTPNSFFCAIFKQ